MSPRRGRGAGERTGHVGAGGDAPRGPGGPRRGEAAGPGGRGDGLLPPGRLAGLPASSLMGARAGRAAGSSPKGIAAVVLPRHGLLSPNFYGGDLVRAG